MKNLLLSLSVLASGALCAQIPTGTGIYLNKVIASPSTSDLTNEYFEFRGTPNTLVPTDLYFINVEGDGEVSGGVPKIDMGKAKEAIALGDGTRTFGSNGMLAVIANYTDENTSVVTTSPYASVIAAGTTVITIELTGNDVTGSSSSNVSTQTPDIGYDGNFQDQSSSYMLVAAPTNPKNVDIDADNDGNIDVTGDHTSWTLYDSVAYLDIDDPVDAGTGETGEYGYAQIVFAREYSANMSNFKINTGATIIEQGSSNINFFARQGMSTGFTAADWIAAATSGTAPNWEFSGDVTKVSPDGFVNYMVPSASYGALNATEQSLSTRDLSLFDGAYTIAPNPVSDRLIITTQGNMQLEKLQLINMNGQVVKSKTSDFRTLDVVDLATGMYVLRLQAASGIDFSLISIR